MNGKREMIKELTNSALSILSKYENDERNGLLTREEAQNTAVSRIQYLRYGEENKDYFWITDMQPKMIIHPYRTDLNGKDLSNFSDPHGKKLFVEFVNTVKELDHGYVDYMWQWKDDSLHIVPKLSYVSIFKPWGWVIGTGIYIEDVKKEIDNLTKKLLWISVGISFSIAFLLLFISQQSLKIEKQRIKANNELHDSKEKYKTLVEATTEGLIMLIDGKISFTNNVLSKMLYYENNELVNCTLNELISENNNKEIISAFSEIIVKEGQYEVNLKKKNGGFIEVLVTSSTAVINGKEVNIIIAKDITVDKNLNLSVLDYQKLLSTLDIGFFRINLDSKGKFIFANDTTIRILGYVNYRDLSETHFIEMLTKSEDRKILRKNLIENGFIKNRVLNIRKKNNEEAYVSVTLVAYNNNDSEDLFCDGIIEDITIKEKEKADTVNLITELKSNSFLIEQSVKNFLSPLNTLDSDATIFDAIDLLNKRKIDNLVITNARKQYIGIVTNSDVQKRVLLLNLNLDNPIYLIMSSPIVYIKESTSICDAINISEEKNVNHLVVRNDIDEVAGILRTNDIYKVLKDSLTFFISNISKAETKNELQQLYKKLHLFIKPLIRSDINVKYITNITSSFSDAVTKRLIELTIKELGNPPTGFTFISMGSEGRKEETLFTDQDNAIIYEDIPDNENNLTGDYFNKLGEIVCDSLNYIGYKYCMGNVMAKNKQWCQPVSVWVKYFEEWVTTPEPQNLLDATIFFDFRCVYGDEGFTNRIKDTIAKLIKEHSLFLYHLAHNTYSIKLQQISSGNIISDKYTESIDLKNAVNPIVMFARTYSLQNNICCSNTFDRLNAIKTKNIISANTVDEILFAYNFLMKLRFKNQIDLSDNNLPLSNTMNLKNLIELEFKILKKILSLIPAYQNKINVDFRLTT
ncbi:MAG: cache domain-containing protein [Ignavibacteriae bacterium]|nr:cache domain-containing protein [Ignavibacteriota bacterium]